MADGPSGPTDWEKANAGRLREAFERAQAAREPLEGKAKDPPPPNTVPRAIQAHGLKLDMQPPELKKMQAEGIAKKDKADAEARLQRAREISNAVRISEQKEKSLELKNEKNKDRDGRDK